MRFLRGQLALALAAVIGVAACTKKETATTKSEDGRKILYHLRTSAERSLDPMQQFDQASHQMVQNLYDALLKYSYLKRPYQMEPNLLTEMPVKQKDGVTYLFKLRNDVYFHDNEAFPGGKGRQMKADDVIYSIKRFADANVNTLSYVLIEGYVEGMDEFREATRKAGDKTDYSKLDIAGVKKVDDFTVSVKFTFDNPLALYPFAFGGLSIVPKEAVEKYGQDFPKNPVGTGPFYMKTYSRRGKHVLVKHPRYHGRYPTEGDPGDKEAGLLADAGKQLPLIDEVHLPLIEETQPAMLKFKKGQLHWIAMNKDEFSNMAYKDKDGKFHLTGEWDKKFKMYTEPYVSTFYMKFNMEDKLVGSNKALRQAIALAMNPEGFIDLMHNGRGLTVNSIVPVTINGSEKVTGATWYKQNLELAKQKLKEAGYPEGKGLPPITVEYRSTNKDSRQQFEYFRADWAKIGIKVNGNFQTFSNFLKRTESGNFQIADAGWGADYPDAENFYQLLYSKNKAPGPNDGNFNNPKYDALYEKSRFMPNGPERFELFKQMNDIIKEEVPVLLVFNPLSFGLYQPNVANMKRNMMVEFPYKYLNLK
ncbi:ABC transporter substrate-binding protein [Pseudobacteriovorax antillogorgiicola]|uniref:ABC-type transport system, substrate-binding protein n=1 Tax=Pseudobacteriovorax antillogorgiicola TaxID=1513793 RepID=A0A1Y6CLK2_9BACT|nr:ABC transporter substrate-binding protein [Pseudobacteriovorax antillogorgiicola]TCS45627.1 ABC-type transport system substrate-binding protein [Pseudobacteriovorax antillogorgiicola]SMF72490.1 ABC-type transport system, substrate-binding protein [Pseudobacteriovorax antillogorgiicola]